MGPRMEFDLLSSKVPCSDDFAFIVRVFGLTGDHSLTYWTPPSCVSTTPEPTTPMDEGALGRAMETNEALKEKISGLKQQYGPIGKQVYESSKDNLFHSFEGYLAREKVLGGGDIG